MDALQEFNNTGKALLGGRHEPVADVPAAMETFYASAAELAERSKRNSELGTRCCTSPLTERGGRPSRRVQAHRIPGWLPR